MQIVLSKSSLCQALVGVLESHLIGKLWWTPNLLKPSFNRTRSSLLRLVRTQNHTSRISRGLAVGRGRRVGRPDCLQSTISSFVSFLLQKVVLLKLNLISLYKILKRLKGHLLTRNVILQIKKQDHRGKVICLARDQARAGTLRLTTWRF